MPSEYPHAALIKAVPKMADSTEGHDPETETPCPRKMLRYFMSATSRFDTSVEDSHVFE